MPKLYFCKISILGWRLPLRQINISNIDFIVFKKKSLQNISNTAIVKLIQVGGAELSKY
jgi:hypothetical protein